MTALLLAFGTTGIALFFVAILLFILGLPFSWWGIKYKLKRGKLKDRMGLVFIRSKGDSFGLPKIVDIDDPLTSFDPERDYPLVREAFSGTKFFGVPSVLFDAEDAKNAIGLCHQEIDATTGEGKWNDDGTPILTDVKPPVCLDPALFKAITVGAALTSYVKNFMQQYKTQLYILIGIAVGIGAAAYFGYEMYSTSLPDVQAKLDLVLQQCSNIGTSAVRDGVLVTK